MTKRSFTLRGFGENKLESAVSYCRCGLLEHGCGFGPHTDTGEWVLTVWGNWSSLDTQTLSLYGAVEID